MARAQQHKCVICGNRPSAPGEYCSICAAKVKKMTRDNKVQQPAYYLHYRGVVVALYPNGNGQFRGEVVKRRADKLPKTRLINLDIRLPLYTRHQVKKLKAQVMSLSSVGITNKRR